MRDNKIIEKKQNDDEKDHEINKRPKKMVMSKNSTMRRKKSEKNVISRDNKYYILYKLSLIKNLK